MTGLQCILHGVKKCVDRQLYVILGEVPKMFSQFVYEVRAVHCANRNLVSSRVGLRNGPYVGGADGGWESVTGSHRHFAGLELSELIAPKPTSKLIHIRVRGTALKRLFYGD